jgi:hypothetical protein
MPRQKSPQSISVACNLLKSSGERHSNQEGQSEVTEEKEMQMNLFELRFVHLEDLIFHETCDFKRTQKLAEEIRRDGHLKNPVLVGYINPEGDQKSNNGKGEKWLVLDGVNRVSALRLLNIPDVLVQSVNYEDERVELSSWSHLIFDANKEEIIEKIKDLNMEVSSCPLNWRKEALKHQKTISYFIFKDMSGIVVNNGSFTPENKVKNLYQLMATYNGRSEICYLDSENHLLSVFDHFKKSSAINLIPRFDKKEILDLVQKNILLPFGVTRFIVPNRVLGLEVSCSVLCASTPLFEKNSFLRELLVYRIRTKKAKFYQESVTLFNE